MLCSEMRCSVPARLAARLSIAALAVAAAALHAADAPACAVLPIDGAGGPRLSVERVALIYDEGRQLEHFVREVRFDQANGAFAFVVPSPTRPEVAAVAKPPFDALAEAFPLDPPPDNGGFFRGEAKSAMPEAGVTVLSAQRIGKFTAFVLAANDAAALDRWLGDNRITLPAGGREWLDHYVRLRFFFTAFRYEAPAGKATSGPPVPPPEAPSRYATPPGGNSSPPPPPGDSPPPSPPAPAGGAPAESAAMTSETVRLSFSTPVPFFPYLEPAHGSFDKDASDHMMLVWLISHHTREPRLRRMASGQAPRWAWPWASRLAYEKSAEDVARPLGELGSLLPADGDYHVQTFRDFRVNRDGWGDILFPVAPSSPDEPGWRKTAADLLGDLEHGLHTGLSDPTEADQEAVFRIPPASRGCACDLGGGGNTGAPWAALSALALALAARRARRR